MEDEEGERGGVPGEVRLPQETQAADPAAWLLQKTQQVARWAESALRLPDTMSSEVAVKSFDGFILCEGDVLLVEADAREIGNKAWARDFGIIRAIPNSTPPPPRNDDSGKRTVTAATLLGILITVGLFVGSSFTDALKSFTLTNNLLVYLTICIATGVMPIEEGLKTMDVGVLLTIVGAFPLGDGLSAVGLDTWTANTLVGGAAPLGQYAVMIAMYLVCCGLSQLISNIAVIAIVAPIAMHVAELQHLRPRSTVLVSVLGASAVFSCPIGHQTNLMVVPLGNYTWGDFFKFGATFQVFHMLLCCFICMYL